MQRSGAATGKFADWALVVPREFCDNEGVSSGFVIGAPRAVWGLAGIWAFSVLLALMLASHHAHAQGESDKAAAEALFDEGQQLLEAGQLDEACAKFRASQQLDAGLGTLLYLADCYERAGKLASSWATFREAESVALSRGDSERAKIARVRAAALKPKLPQLLVVAPPSAPEGFEVKRNGRVIPPASYDVPVPVDPGIWSIVCAAPGYRSVELSVRVEAGATEPYRLELPELEPAPTPAVQSEPTQPDALSGPGVSSVATPGLDDQAADPGDGQRILAFIVGGAGVVAALASGVLTVLAANKDAESRDECPDDPNRCSVAGTRLRDDALGLAGMATVSGIVGVVGIGAGTTLYFTAPKSEDSSIGAIGVAWSHTW
jgi:hypothetical protein